MRYVQMEDDFRVEDVAEALISAGYGESSTLADILADRVPKTPKTVSLDFSMDREELVEHASAETLQSQLFGMNRGGSEDAEAAVRYALAGDRILARTMFERVLDPAVMSGVERALRS